MNNNLKLLKSTGLFALFAGVFFIAHVFGRSENNVAAKTEIPIGDQDVVFGRGSGAHDSFATMPDFENPPTIEPNDLIYNPARNTVPIVNEEYNVVFFLVAKAASSEWIRFFMRLNSSSLWCANGVHSRTHQGLKFLSDYSIEEATEMMTSKDWTRAIFVRNPKPRILSAFLDKAVSHKEGFIRDKCPIYASRGGDYDECVERREDFSFFLYNITTTMNKNVHWRSIYSRVDEKWWPWMNYVANMEALSDDAEHFLKSLKSNIDGASAWDRIGRTGWSDNERDCDNLGDSAFLAKKDTKHKTNAKDQLRQYYTPELEKFVETHYADDFNNPNFHFSEVKLYDDKEEELD